MTKQEITKKVTEWLMGTEVKWEGDALMYGPFRLSEEQIAEACKLTTKRGEARRSSASTPITVEGDLAQRLRFVAIARDCKSSWYALDRLIIVNGMIYATDGRRIHYTECDLPDGQYTVRKLVKPSRVELTLVSSEDTRRYPAVTKILPSDNDLTWQWTSDYCDRKVVDVQVIEAARMEKIELDVDTVRAACRKATRLMTVKIQGGGQETPVVMTLTRDNGPNVYCILMPMDTE